MRFTTLNSQPEEKKSKTGAIVIGVIILGALVAIAHWVLKLF